jgi:antitoxin component YwqK of YwqJK toxin-antitoxin module
LDAFGHIALVTVGVLATCVPTPASPPAPRPTTAATPLWRQCLDEVQRELARVPAEPAARLQLGSWLPRCPAGSTLQGPRAKQVPNETDLVEAECIDASGAREGPHAWWDEGGRIRQLGSYRAGRRTGRWFSFHGSGQLHEATDYEDGRRHGWSANWHESGQLLVAWGAVRDTHHGLSCELTSEGEVLSAGHYVDGRRQGHWMFRMSSDELEQPERFASRARVAQFESGHLVGDRRQGRWCSIRRDGTANWVAHYHDGKLHGPHIQWDRDGFVELAGEYRDGKRQGTWRHYHQGPGPPDTLFRAPGTEYEFDQGRETSHRQLDKSTSRPRWDGVTCAANCDRRSSRWTDHCLPDRMTSRW